MPQKIIHHLDLLVFFDLDSKRRIVVVALDLLTPNHSQHSLEDDVEHLQGSVRVWCNFSPLSDSNPHSLTILLGRVQLSHL
jgi:hypothetical protein